MLTLLLACVTDVHLVPAATPADTGTAEAPPPWVWCKRRAGRDTVLEAELLAHGPRWARYAYDWNAHYTFHCDTVDLLDVGASVCPTSLDGVAGPHAVLCLDEVP